MGTYSQAVAWPGGAASSGVNSRLPNVDNRGVCTVCHLSAGGGVSDGCTGCHGQPPSSGSHAAHFSKSYGPALANCDACHRYADGTHMNGQVNFSDGAATLASTTVCNPCHSPDGVYDGVNDPVIGAKTSWKNGVYSSGNLTAGKETWFLSCHDDGQAVVKGQTAPNKIGNNSTFGYNLTGHGRSSGSTHARMSWQGNAATGNLGAGLSCMSCHTREQSHINLGSSNKRLRPGYENTADNNCKQCHDPGTRAVSGPQFYTTYAAYQNSAHGGKNCTDCHEVHGTAGTYAAMSKGSKENLCSQCHGSHGGHALNTAFGKGGKNYTLQCTSCHNVHVVSGITTQADPNKSPVSLFSSNTSVWGAIPSQKMSAFAGSGTYRTPNGDSMSGSQLPDYPTFCLDCHGQDMTPSGRGNISWSTDPHGRAAANEPNGYGTCPNWFACGNAPGWNGDDVDEGKGWPVVPSGEGDQLYSRAPFTHAQRVAGANFTLSCTDCHETHISGSSKLRSTVNGSPGSTIWNTECNACHYYYSDWHAGMSCGNASCHVSNSIHRASNMSGSGGTRTHTSGLVTSYAFENNLKDSGGYQLDGKWYSAAGSFAAGKSGQAVVLDQGKTVQVGTENGYWSTDEGYHGTWKFTEMKYNTTLEAWVYPTDNAKSEYTIFNKHVGVSTNGGYAFTLKKINGGLRAAFSMAADSNGGTQDGRAGVRGAYSSIAVPVNKWTHVAATFDANGPDRNPGDPSVGRIRIYVNGEDVTTSDSTGNSTQPGTGENSIYAYSENSPWNEGICYNGSWCASEFSIGGFDWETTNFIGRIDDAKVWNITKDASYLASLDSQTAPYISQVEGMIGSNQLSVKFSEGVYTNVGSSGALVPADFTLTDTGGNNPRTITGVTHTAGSATAVVAMSQPLTANDVNSDTLAAATASSIFDNYNSGMGNEAATIGLSSLCPTSPVSIQLNETSGSTYIMDTQNVLYGAIAGGSSAFPGDGSFHGNGSSANYIDFSYSQGCLLASTVMTLETRIKPTGLSGTGSYLRRIIERNAGSANYQLSVWRNNGATGFSGYNAPSGEASIALWVAVADAHGGDIWKPVLTNYSGAATGTENSCPIMSDHWYQARAVWNTSKPGGTPGQVFQQAGIYVDDQGTNGNDAGDNWTGYLNCTDTDQSLKDLVKKFYANDQIVPAAGQFRIGSNVSGGNLFNGLIDWITWASGQ